MKLFIKSFGCQMNEYDSAKIVDLMAKSCNFVTTEDPAEADLIVLNTCAVREKAAEKVFSELGRFKFLKKKNPGLVVAVGGCVSKQEEKNIFQRALFVDIVFGPQTLHRLPEFYNRSFLGEAKIIDVSDASIDKFNYFPKPSKSGPVAYVSIMEGCNKYCSYCVVPYTRGIETSRAMRDILVEIEALVDQGAKEIHLLGQNVNAYRDPVEDYKLSDLVERIAKIENVLRIRFTTSHPADFSDDLVLMFEREPKLVSHLHLPIQSGSNRILKLMRRGYTREDYQEIIVKLRKVRPNISISTDFIVGFPGETDEDFQKTMEIVREINFDSSFSFIYSPRPNTQALKMDDNILLSEKKKRLASLQDQLGVQARQYSKDMVGSVQLVLVTNCEKKDPKQFLGRTENNRMVSFSSSEDLLGKMVQVKITEALSNSLRGDTIV